MLFRSFARAECNGRGNSTNFDDDYGGSTTSYDKLYCLPTRVQNTYDALTSFMLSYCHGYPRLLLTNAEMSEIQMLFEQLAPTSFMTDTYDKNHNKKNNDKNKQQTGNSLNDHDDRHFGEVLLFLLDELTDGKDYADVLQHSKPRFAILLLKELVHQGVHIDSLIFDKLITLSQAQILGASH